MHPLDAYRFEPKARPTTKVKKELFIRGPIPVGWMARACTLPGMAAQVAVAIWFLRGLRGSDQFALTPSTLIRFNVNRYSGYRGLKQLEKAGLISVRRRKGAGPIINIIRDRRMPTPKPKKGR
jgi:hypothetical protein